MQSATSSSERPAGRWFYPTLYLKNLRRFWPVWALYLVIWLFALPLNILSNRYSGPYWPHSLILGTLSFMAVALAVMFGLAAAMAVFSYLYSPRSAGMLHALPVTREGLFLTNWLSGFSFLLLPNALVFLLTLLAEAVVGRVSLLPLVLWFLSTTLICLFFFSFAVFCAMFTGHLLALPVFYGILNILALALAWLFNELAGRFLFGFHDVSALQQLSFWLTPAAQLSTQLYPSFDVGGGAGPLHGFLYVLLYAAVGAVLSVLALIVYRRRQLERAGDIVSVGWVRPVFKYGVAACSAVSLGTFLHTFLFGSLPSNAWGLLGFMLLWGLVGYFAAEMLLRKSFRVFRRSWRGAVGFSVALVLCCCALEFDLAGFERRIPDPRSVAAVSLSGISSAPHDSASTYLPFTDPDDIAAVTALHASITARKDELDGLGYDYESEYLPLLGLDVETRTTTQLGFTYTLTSGKTVSRSYIIPVTSQLLGDPDTPAARLDALLNRPQRVSLSYFDRLPENALLTLAGIETFDETGGLTYNTVSNQDLTPLLSAIAADIAQGRLGRRYLLEDLQRQEDCFHNDLRLTFSYPSTPSDPPDAAPGRSPKTQTVSREIVITLQSGAENTLRELERLELINDTDRRIFTRAQLPLQEKTWTALGGGDTQVIYR